MIKTTMAPRGQLNPNFPRIMFVRSSTKKKSLFHLDLAINLATMVTSCLKL
jgi:hypothetical protein